MAVLGANSGSFLREALVILAELEDFLRLLEESPADSEVIGRVFRAFNALDMAGRMYGFDEMSLLAHDAATHLALARHGEVTVDRELIDRAKSATSRIRDMLDPS